MPRLRTPGQRHLLSTGGAGPRPRLPPMRGPLGATGAWSPAREAPLETWGLLNRFVCGCVTLGKALSLSELNPSSREVDNL